MPAAFERAGRALADGEAESVPYTAAEAGNSVAEANSIGVAEACAVGVAEAGAFIITLAISQAEAIALSPGEARRRAGQRRG